MSEKFSIKLTSNLDDFENVQKFVLEKLSDCDCSQKILMQIEIMVEEIFVNISKYGYAPDEGEITVQCGIEKTAVEITFTDFGKKFNPLQKEDADTSLSAEERPVGGLGIFMTKKFADSLDYKYEDGKNILTIRKNFG